MTMQQISDLGKGGAGMHGQSDGGAFAAIKELQGFTLSLLAGASADTKIDLSAIRTEDTIMGALNNNAGTITDVSANMSIVDLRASGTITVGTEAAGDIATVSGRTFTLVAEVTDPLDYTKVLIGADADATAVNLAAAINKWQENVTATVVASVASNVVTITALAEGTGGNAITLTETGNSFTVSGATLSGGSATGGVQCSSTTQQLILFWYNKK